MKLGLFDVCLVALVGCSPAIDPTPQADSDTTGESTSTGFEDERTTTGQRQTGTSSGSSGDDTTTAAQTGFDESSSSSTGEPIVCGSPLLDPGDRLHLEASPMRGNPDGLVTIVQWTGYEDPFSSAVQDTIAALFEGPLAPQLRLVAKQMPLRFQDPGGRLARAGLAAHALGAYWAFHDAMFAYEGDLDDEAVDAIATDVGLDLVAFHDAMQSAQVQAALGDDGELFAAVGATGTPSSVVNGTFLSGAQPLATFEAVVEEELEAMEALIAQGTSPCVAFDERLDDVLP